MRMANKPLIIAFDGVQGAGKSTVMNAVRDSLTSDRTVACIEEVPVYGAQMGFSMSDVARTKGNLSALFMALHVEKLRANKAEENTADIILVDKTFPSLLASGFARSKFRQGQNTQPDNHIVRDTPTEKIKIAWPRLLRPDHIIMVDRAAADCIEGINTRAAFADYREILLRETSHPQYQDVFRSLYKGFKTSLMPFTPISTIENSGTIEDARDKALDVIFAAG
mgnify:CR=1 FL=1